MQYLKISFKDKFMRFIWIAVQSTIFRFTPIFLHRWRILLINCFGGNVSYSSFVYPDVKIWAPWNLIMGADSTLAFGVICYNPGSISIGKSSTVSQFTHLCSAGHDYEHPDALKTAKFPLVVSPIRIGSNVWITADCFISPGVIVADWAVVLPRSLVIKNISESMVVGGSPALPIRKRIIRCAESS